MATNMVVKIDELIPTDKFPRHQQVMGETNLSKPHLGKKRWAK